MAKGGDDERSKRGRDDGVVFFLPMMALFSSFLSPFSSCLPFLPLFLSPPRHSRSSDPDTDRAGFDLFFFRQWKQHTHQTSEARSTQRCRVIFLQASSLPGVYQGHFLTWETPGLTPGLCILYSVCMHRRDAIFLLWSCYHAVVSVLHPNGCFIIWLRVWKSFWWLFGPFWTGFLALTESVFLITLQCEINVFG